MPTHHILFIHGVNVRKHDYAQTLIDRIHQALNQTSEPIPQVRFIPLYWSNIVEGFLAELRQDVEASPQWSHFWFKHFRQDKLLRFSGDAALYISRHVGSLAVEQLAQQALEELQSYQLGDYLHLVTHSWGTVILFDMLFSKRWAVEEALPGHSAVQEFRDLFFGIGDHPNQGMRLASIHTMGSPIPIFNLIHTVKPESPLDITTGLKTLLENTYGPDQKLTWCNFAHPGDPIAWPLEKTVSRLMQTPILEITDELVDGSGLLEFFAKQVRHSFWALINGGNAHSSYWRSKKVADRIQHTIRSTAIQSIISPQPINPPPVSITINTAATPA
ncbi:hypothetical protein [Thermocoleostomius sinensis]|uniref:Alpha/beta hydrolase n=1 Tax=Thermocoleostomius sinensis A174 TaxID=2016057 RepID=A0A9E9CA77_9CYAN|nr:hypothetical protein [Thermocoleostomius sinensis]WAL62508.1 hypothetical protein OXH18_11095 [Thermocoleostomius sinensis A174]